MAENDLPDLDAVDKTIHEAHAAEDALKQTMPNAIDPDDDDSPGMVPVDADPADPLEAQAEVAEEPAPARETGTEEVEDEEVEDEVLDRQTPDTKTPDTETLDTKTPDTKTPDTKTPDTHASGTQSSESEPRDAT